ncbi:MAG: hypothetical protein A2133_12745 [Actinobacteria bacterium RBG_16_64_13]|nr:MAG: hypothetical protein A2133_12745 [Actinobacteria bacterium RBG_16_64_13]
MEIVSCPKCGRPRALGHRCPSCGDAPTVVNEQPTTPDEAESWRGAAGSWRGVAEPGGVPTGRALAAPPQRAPGGKKGRGLLATIIVAVVLIVAIAVVVAVLTAGGAAVLEEEASVASAPQKAHDLAAQSLLRNAMTAIDAAFVESADYTAITQSTLQAMEPAITWMPGSAGVSASPPAGAKAQQNAVTWACTGRMTYEIGTWSASGVEFGVRVNRAGGGNTFYTGGSVAAW